MPIITDLREVYFNGEKISKAFFNGVEYKIEAKKRYFTRIDTSSKGFDLESLISITAGKMAYRLKMAIIGNVSARISAISSFTKIEFDSFSGNVEFLYRSGGASYPLATLESSYGSESLVDYVLKYDGTNVEGFINDVSVGSTARPSGGFDINDIFPAGSSGNSVYYPQSLEIWSDTDDTSTDPDWYCKFDSDGTGSKEIDTVGGNNLTRIGLTSVDTELFTFDEYLNVWKNEDESVVLPVTY